MDKTQAIQILQDARYQILQERWGPSSAEDFAMQFAFHTLCDAIMYLIRGKL